MKTAGMKIRNCYRNPAILGGQVMADGYATPTFSGVPKTQKWGTKLKLATEPLPSLRVRGFVRISGWVGFQPPPPPPFPSPRTVDHCRGLWVNTRGGNPSVLDADYPPN